MTLRALSARPYHVRVGLAVDVRRHQSAAAQRAEAQKILRLSIFAVRVGAGAAAFAEHLLEQALLLLHPVPIAE